MPDKRTRLPISTNKQRTSKAANAAQIRTQPLKGVVVGVGAFSAVVAAFCSREQAKRFTPHKNAMLPLGCIIPLLFEGARLNALHGMTSQRDGMTCRKAFCLAPEFAHEQGQQREAVIIKLYVI